jgi:Zn-dependent protease with chaperone function
LLRRGKVFVFSGILPICDGDDGLAAVLGHEIAHKVAHHVEEKLSQLAIVIPIVFLASQIYDVSSQFLQLAIDYAYTRPGSRKQEVCLANRVCKGRGVN